MWSVVEAELPSQALTNLLEAGWKPIGTRECLLDVIGPDVFDDPPDVRMGVMVILRAFVGSDDIPTAEPVVTELRVMSGLLRNLERKMAWKG